MIRHLPFCTKTLWHGSADGSSLNVVEFAIFPDAAQHQAAAAHVAPSDELRGNTQPVAENWCQDVQILAGGETSEENQFAVGTDVCAKLLGAAPKRGIVDAIVDMDRHATEAPQFRQSN